MCIGIRINLIPNSYKLDDCVNKDDNFCSFFDEQLEFMDGLYYYKFVALQGLWAPVFSNKRDYHVYFTLKRKQCMIPEELSREVKT